MANGQLFRMDHLNGKEAELRPLFNVSADLVMDNVNHMNAFASLSMASSSIGKSRGIPVVGIRNTYCECSIRARIMISESERNPNRLYATCAKYPKYNYYVWLIPQRVGDREPAFNILDHLRVIDCSNFKSLDSGPSTIGWDDEPSGACVAFLSLCSSILFCALVRGNLQVRNLTLFNRQAIDEHHRLSNSIRCRVALVNILPMFSVISRTASLNSSLFELHLFLFLYLDQAFVPHSTPGPLENSMSSPVWGPNSTLWSV
ncbi:sister chromatid cohesion protein PDS5-like protein [Senna tora]|uniref:Sister chromatid cohesion protein PDS5-like protein n=1 Tax=Senna tora TaxID=362788 RepID=A0A835CIK4_9FABA|nr:sister chromatid cohesion protein PDS5-like protein [Senna tora]